MTLDGDDFTDWQVVDIVFALCILIDQGSTVQDAFDTICKQNKIVLSIDTI